MPVKDVKKYKFSQKPFEQVLQQVLRETEDNFVALDKDGDIVINRDIHCRSLYVDETSLYIGGVKFEKPTHDDDNYYLQYDRANKKFTYQSTTTPTTESVQDIVGAMVTGNTETLIAVTYQDADGTLDFVVDEANIDHDNLTNTHNLTTDIDHDQLTNTHNLTTDIDHDALTNFVSNEHLPGIDEDDMVSDSDTSVPTQQSVKAYVDAVLPSLVCSDGAVVVNDGEVVWQS